MSDTHKFQEDGSHYNGGAVFFGYGFRAVGEPRLKLIRRWYKGKRRGQIDDHYFVDGKPVTDYEAALSALTVPVVFTTDEVTALAEIGDEPANYNETFDFLLLHSLSEKGAIEWGPPGKCRRTDVGRTAAVSPNPLSRSQEQGREE